MTKVVINIPDADYKSITEDYISYADTESGRVYKAIKNGIVLPDNPTNGDMIKALFSHCPTYPLVHDICFYADETRQTMVVAFPTEWWDAPYKGGRMFEIAIKLDENVYTRLFDNGVEMSEEDITAIQMAIREGTILKPHGKLIDADALECESYLISKGNGMYEEVKGYFNIDDAPTILEATEEG